LKKIRVVITCGIMAAALSHLPAMANDIDIVTMQKVVANELMLIPALDLKIVPSHETNFPTIDSIEILVQASTEEFGGALQFESNISAATDYSEPTETMLTLDTESGAVDTTFEQRVGTVPFRWQS